MDESAHHALVNAGGREIVEKKEGEHRQKGSARGSVHWGCYYATARPEPWTLIVCVYYCRTYDKAVCGPGGGVGQPE